MRKFLFLFFVLPLAACFDAEMSLNFPDQDTAEATMVMTASADFFEMSVASGEPFCDEGIEAELEDGSRSCTETFTGTIDEALANPDIGDSMSVERRDGGLLYVSWDLSDLTKDIVPPEEEGAEEMMDMMIAAFEGHAITLNVSGAQIVETNGAVSDDGKTAMFRIPLEDALQGAAELPASFDVLLAPGA